MASWSRRLGIGALSVALSLAIALAGIELLTRWLEHRQQLRNAAQPLQEGDHGVAFHDWPLGEAGFLAPGYSGFVTNEYGQRVEWINDNFGFRTRQRISRSRPPGVLRILMLGDSFVVGHRLGQDQTVGYQIEKWLRANGHPSAEVLIAETEEPVAGLDYLETFGVTFQPQVVLLGITLGNDLAQAYFSLGGDHSRYRLVPQPTSGAELEPNPKADHKAQLAFIVRERMPADSHFGPGPGPPPDQLHPESLEGGTPSVLGLHFLGHLAAGWLARRTVNAPQAITSHWNEYRNPYLFDGNGLSMCLSPAPPAIERTFQLLFEVLEAYQRVCRRHGIRFMVMVHSQRYQVQPGDLAATIKAFSLNPSRFDWMAPNRRIREFCAAHDIPCFDPTEAMAKEYARTHQSLFMPRGDMHWNSKGARAFFLGIRADLGKQLGVPAGD
jgi:hypothetical protein